MPTYEYKCEHCGFEFEHFQSISSEPIRICPKCRQETVMRKISGGTGLIFKGSGFYITDYVNKKTGPQESPPKPKSSSPAAAKETAKPTQKAADIEK
jgi:putative FmdB family regulatory protein